MNVFARAACVLVLITGLAAACGPADEARNQTAPGPPAAGAGGSAPVVVVVRVIDGDTLVVDLDGVDTTIRLLNVDAPETKDPNKAVQCLGPEASAFLTKLLPPGTGVALEYDGEKLDRYGRTLAGVWLREMLVNAEVARAGLGAPVQYNGQTKFLPPVRSAAREAKRRKRGAYADRVDCALPAQVSQALARMATAPPPRSATSKAYAAAIESLAVARDAGRRVKRLTRTAQRASGSTAWAFHDVVRSTQRSRLDDGLRSANHRLSHLRTVKKKLQKREKAAVRKRAHEQELRQLQVQREEAARAAAAEQQRLERRAQRQTAEPDPPKRSGGSSNPPGYTGPRCYEPGGKVWHPC